MPRVHTIIQRYHTRLPRHQARRTLQARHTPQARRATQAIVATRTHTVAQRRHRNILTTHRVDSTRLSDMALAPMDIEIRW